MSFNPGYSAKVSASVSPPPMVTYSIGGFSLMLYMTVISFWYSRSCLRLYIRRHVARICGWSSEVLLLRSKYYKISSWSSGANALNESFFFSSAIEAGGSWYSFWVEVVVSELYRIEMKEKEVILDSWPKGGASESEAFKLLKLLSECV